MPSRPMWIKYCLMVLNSPVPVQLPANSAELWRGREEGWEQEGRSEEVRRERRREISAVR